MVEPAVNPRDNSETTTLDSRADKRKPNQDVVAKEARPPAELEPGATVITPEGKGKEAFEIKQAKKQTKKAEGYKVQYSAEKSKDTDGFITKYLWDFDADGVFDVISGEAKLKKDYLDYGKVFVLLRVEDNNRPPGWDAKAVAVELPRSLDTPKLPLKASAVMFPREIPLGGKLIAGASITGGVPPYEVSWSFSDGQSSSEEIISLAPLKVGKFTGRLTVKDAEGSIISREASAQVVAPQKVPTAALKMKVTPQRVLLDAPGKVDFTISVPEAKEPLSIRAEAHGSGKVVKGEGLAFSFLFDNSGYDVLSVTVTDTLGRAAKTFVPVRVGGFEEGVVGLEAPESAPDFSVKIEPDGSTVRLTATSTSRDAKITWQLGDGTSMTGREIKKKYAKPGVYKVTQEVDDGFRFTIKEKRIPISGGKFIAGIDLPERLVGTAPFTIFPKAVVAGGKFPLFYRWKIGGLFSDDEKPRFTLDTAGSYQLQLTVIDADGKSYDAEPVGVRVLRKPPDYRYAVAYVPKLKSEENGNGESGEKASAQPSLVFVEFDGSGTYEIPLDFAPTGVSLAPAGKLFALKGNGRFSVYELYGLAKILEFQTKHGTLEKVFLTQHREKTFFNILPSGGAETSRGYLFSPETGFIPVGEADERILAVSLNADRLLTANERGEARILAVDPFSSTIVEHSSLDERAVEGVLSSDGKVVFILTPDDVLYRIEVDSGVKQRLSGDNKGIKNIQASENGKVFAYNNEQGEIIVGKIFGEAESDSQMPISISAINHFYSNNFRLSQDGKLIVAYGKENGKSGLYLITIDMDLKTAKESELSPRFLAESSEVFDLSASLAPFDTLMPTELAPSENQKA